MNYRDFFKNKRVNRKDILSLLPEGVDQKEFDKGIGAEKEHTDDEFIAAKIAGDHLKEDPKYYTKLNAAGLEEEEVDECGTCGCGDPSDDHSGDDYDENGGLPTLGGALAVPHRGQPIMMGKIIQVGGIGGGLANGAVSGMTNVKDKGVPATQPGDKEPITAGGKASDSSVASKSVGGNVVPGEGQEQGGPNSQGTIAGTSKLSESKERVRKIVKKVLKEVRYNRETGKWEKINENVDMKMGASYKVVQPRQYKVSDDDFARTNQYDPEITEMYDDEEECMMNERYVELANAGRNLSEAELSELKVLREKIDKIAISKRNYGLSQGGVEPTVFESRCEDYPCCGHEDGDCPDRDEHGNETWKCAKCGARLPKGARSSLCNSCISRMNRMMDDDPTGQDMDNFEENTVNMKMGPSHKTVQPTLAKTAADDFARTNQYDPQVSKVHDAGAEPPVHQGHKGQSGFRLWVCSKCQHELMVPATERRPDDIRWTDGHVCRFVPAKDGEGVGAEPVGIGEAGGAAVQHSSYRTVDHGNLPQKPKQRWADDLDEASKKPSKVAKTIAKGQKPAKTKKNPLLKFQKAKKTTSGVHKRKT